MILEYVDGPSIITRALKSRRVILKRESDRQQHKEDLARLTGFEVGYQSGEASSL